MFDPLLPFQIRELYFRCHSQDGFAKGCWVSASPSVSCTLDVVPKIDLRKDVEFQTQDWSCQSVNIEGQSKYLGSMAHGIQKSAPKVTVIDVIVTLIRRPNAMEADKIWTCDMMWCNLQSARVWRMNYVKLSMTSWVWSDRHIFPWCHVLELLALVKVNTLGTLQTILLAFSLHEGLCNTWQSLDRKLTGNALVVV